MLSHQEWCQREALKCQLVKSSVSTNWYLLKAWLSPFPWLCLDGWVNPGSCSCLGQIPVKKNAAPPLCDSWGQESRYNRFSLSWTEGQNWSVCGAAIPTNPGWVTRELGVCAWLNDKRERSWGCCWVTWKSACGRKKNHPRKKGTMGSQVSTQWVQLFCSMLQHVRHDLLPWKWYRSKSELLWLQQEPGYESVGSQGSSHVTVYAKVHWKYTSEMSACPVLPETLEGMTALSSERQQELMLIAMTNQACSANVICLASFFQLMIS